MGLDYSLVALVPRQESANLLFHLAEILDQASADRLPKIKWIPEAEAFHLTTFGTNELDARGIAGLQLSECESQNDYCFCLSVQLEADMLQFVRCYEFDCIDRIGSFGCMWTSIFGGTNYLIVQMTAATSDMSRVLANSTNVRKLWSGFAKQVNALVAYIDVEDDLAIQVYPQPRDLILRDYDFIAFEDAIGLSADLLAQHLIDLNPLLKC